MSKKKSSKKSSKSTAVVDPRLVEASTNDMEIDRLKRELKYKNDQLHRMVSGQHAWETALERLFLDPQVIYLPRKPAPDKRKSVGERTMVVHISDTQIGKTTETYNTTVARDRLKLLAKKVGQLVEAERSCHKVESLRVYLGGDIVEGERVFPTQPHFIDSAVIDQATVHAPTMLCDFITEMAGIFRDVRVVCVRGNHGRGGRYDPTNPATNWDSVAYRTLGLMLSSKEIRDRVTFINDVDSFYQIDYIYDWGFLLVHGDQIKGHLLPWYGVCVPDTCEAMTRSGWKTHEQLCIGEEVLGYNVETGKSEWTVVKEVNVHKYVGKMHKLQNHGHEALFTPNHNMICDVGSNGRVSRKLVRASDVKTSHWLPMSGEYIGSDDSILSPRHAAILGWVVTDGTARWMGNYWEAGIYQSPKKHLALVEELVGRKGRDPRTDGKDDCSFVPLLKEDSEAISAVYTGKDDLPAIVGKLSREAADAMLEAMMMAEGCISRPVAKQNPGPVHDALLMLAIMCGHAPTSTDDSGSNCKVVRLCTRKRVKPTWNGGFSLVDYDGTVWCPTTKLGTWWMRSGGLVMPTGNSKKSAGWQDSLTETINGYDISKPWDYLMFGHFHNYCGPVIVNMRTWMCNGTTESSNEYAAESLAASGHPVQRVGFVSAAHGWEKDCSVFLGNQRLSQAAQAGYQTTAPERHSAHLRG